ncbi:MAG: DNA-3-methyladenine glycosylase 2 family protein [Phycisphaerae bacterium]
MCAVDARLAGLIARIGPHRPLITHSPFNALVGAILQQQVSMKAAAAMERKLRAQCPSGRISSPAIAALRLPQLRKAGLSRQKCAYVSDLAARFVRRELNAAMLRRMNDDEVIEATTRVKGIGRWTAEMLLIFCLERPDVWPIDDLGLRKAVRQFLGLSDFADKQTITQLAEPWRPYRSYATWYLWRSLEGPFMPGKAVT